MEFIDKTLSNYCQNYTSAESDVLTQLNRETHLRVVSPRMLSGHLQGRFLSFISKLKQPNLIVEIGTYTGYASLCLCEGMQKNGQLHTIDIKEELVDFQRKYFDQSGWGAQIVQHLGEGTVVIPTLDLTFDLVFIDADKENYLNYYELIVPKMNPGGIAMLEIIISLLVYFFSILYSVLCNKILLISSNFIEICLSYYTTPHLSLIHI